MYIEIIVKNRLCLFFRNNNNHDEGAAPPPASPSPGAVGDPCPYPHSRRRDSRGPDSVCPFLGCVERSRKMGDHVTLGHLHSCSGWRATCWEWGPPYWTWPAMCRPVRCSETLRPACYPISSIPWTPSACSSGRSHLADIPYLDACTRPFLSIGGCRHTWFLVWAQASDMSTGNYGSRRCWKATLYPSTGCPVWCPRMPLPHPAPQRRTGMLQTPRKKSRPSEGRPRTSRPDHTRGHTSRSS